MSAVSSRHLLVTGAAGFIGRAVVRAALARGHRVTALVRQRAGGPAEGGTTVVADLARDAIVPVLSGVDAVVHCAASLGGDSAAQQVDTVEATARLGAAMSEAGVARIVLASSIAVYDFAALTPGQTLDEAGPLASSSDVRGPYIAAKLAQERLVQDPARGLDWRILRPGLVFGPGRTWSHDLGMALHPRLWLTFAGSATLPLTYVDNCAAALVAAAEGGASRRFANVVDDGLPTRSAYVRALAAATQPSPVVLDVPWGVMARASGLAARMGVTPGVLHPSRLAARAKPLAYDNRAAKDQWGWAPAVPIAEALARSRQA